MADISYAQSKVDGVLLPAVAATAGPDRVRPDERGIVIVHNGSGSAITATVTDPGSTKYGKANPDLTSASIAAGAHWAFGPFPTDLMDPADGWVDIQVSVPTSVNYFGVRA